jgi:hypothetical protein
MERPSNRELYDRVSDALAAILAGKYQFLSKHIAGDLEELEVTDEKELISLVAEGLREIRAETPAKCWVGGRPPARSYEPELKKLELWAFSWRSEIFGCDMYLKFAIKRGVYMYVDCHGDRP